MITRIAPWQAGNYREQLLPLFRKVVHTTNGCYTAEDIADECEAGRVDTWIAWSPKRWPEIDAVATTYFANHPRRKICAVKFIAGTRLREWIKEGVEAIDAFAREHGCDGVLGSYRKGWVPLMGARMIGANYLKDL